MSNLTGQKPRQKPAAPVRDREYLEAVKSLPCAVCGAPPPSDAHHCIHDRFGTRKVSDLDAIPLCKRHHQWGPEAIHSGKESWRKKHGPDWGFIEQTREMATAPWVSSNSG